MNTDENVCFISLCAWECVLEQHRDCLSKHAYMHFVLVDIMNLCVCVLLCVCVCWWRYQSKQSQGRIGMLRRTGEKRMLSAWSAHTHTHTQTPIHTHTQTSPPFSLSWPLLLLYVWHAALKLQLRGTTLSTWGILYLYITLSSFAHLFFALCLTSLLPHSLP